MLSYKTFIHSMTNKIYKILPLRESEKVEDRKCLAEYISSIFIEATGALIIFKDLEDQKDYVDVINTLAYLDNYDLPLKTCRREVFKMCKLLNKIEAESGGFIE